MPKKNDYIFFFKIVIIEATVTIATMFLFAAVIYFLEGGYQYSPLFATISVGFGSFLSSFYASKKIGKNGLMIGVIIGGVTFILLTLFGLMASKDVFGINTLFRMIIIVLLSLIGGVFGVNSKQNQKYI